MRCACGDGEQPRDRIGRRRRSPEARRVGVEQRVQIVRAAAELVRRGCRTPCRTRSGRRRSRRARGWCTAGRARARRGSVHWSAGASKLRLLLRRMKFEPPPVRTLNCAPLKPPRLTSYGVVTSDDDDLRVAREVRAAEAGAVERRAVLVGREAEHGEAGRIAVGVGDRRDAGDRRGHGVEVALLVGGDGGAARPTAPCR